MTTTTMNENHKSPPKTAPKSANGRKKTDESGRWDFVKLAPLMGGISLILTIASLVLLMTKGLNFGIDFRGGTEIQVKFTEGVQVGPVRAALESAGISNPTVQTFGSQSELLIRLETPRAATDRETNQLINANVTKVESTLKSGFPMAEEGILRVDTVGPQVGSELKRNGLLAVFYSLLIILIYVSMRFDYKYAPGAVLCLVHDVALTAGLFSLLGREFNVQILAAILTLIGYSLNDTIVTFDRIRETMPYAREKGLRFVINKAINDMMGRTILTALTTLVAVSTLFVLAGGVISDIAFTLIIGVVVGTYSSIYVAAPMILISEKFKKRMA